MKYEQIEHALFYHVVPFILFVAVVFCLFRLLLYFHKSKQRNQKPGKKKPGKIEFPPEMKSAKQRQRQRRKK